MYEQDILIGSELFINDKDKPEQIKAWVSQMKEAKLKIIRLFVMWSHVQPQEDQWDFSKYDAVFSEAERLGMGVVPTFMSVNPPK